MAPEAQNSSPPPPPPSNSPPPPPGNYSPPPPAETSPTQDQKIKSPASPSKVPTPGSGTTPATPGPDSEQSPLIPSLLDSKKAKQSSKDHSSPKEGEGLSTGAIVALGVVFGLLLVGILGTASYVLFKRKKRIPTGHAGGYVMPSAASHELYCEWAQMRKPPLGFQHRSKGSSFSSRAASSFRGSNSFFSYEELSEATGGFSSKNLLGEGGFGSVHKGELFDGREVAIKKSKEGSQQGEREFRAEVEIITRIHHRYLVSLVGYCIHENRRLLVYDYVPNNNLYFHLHGEGAPVLFWSARVKIAIGAARGIAYLHEDCQPRIIHRDIKSSNILLDNNFEARVSDFGLAKLAVDVYTHVTTRVMGTFGYPAPEYASTGKLTEKSDVYSYGVVLLELITGRKPVDKSQPEGQGGLVEWARPALSKALETNDFGPVADPRLKGDYVNGEMFKMVEVAAACIRHAHKKRPNMGQVVRAFDIMVAVDLTNGMKVGESEIFDSENANEYKLLQKMAFENQELNTEFFNQCGSSK